MQTTAVQWLAEMLEDCRYRIEDAGHLIDQANKMFEQQMKEAVLNQVTTHPRFRKIFEEQFEHWFNETYGSNKNDEYTEINWGGVIQKIPQEQLEKEINPNYKYFDIRVPTSSQTEISDEEIEKAAIEYYESAVGNLDREIGFRYACKWYREQLKSKGNGETK